MPRTLTCLFLFPLLFSVHTLPAQTDSFVAGYYLTPDSQRVTGKLLVAEPVELSRGVVFKDEGGNQQDLNPRVAAAFGFLSLPHTEYRTVPYAYYTREGERIEEERFAKVVQGGNAALLELELPSNSYPRPFARSVDRLFYLLKDGRAYKLEYIITEEGGNIREDERYKAVLGTALADGNIPPTRLRRLNYDRQSLSALIYQYNNATEGDPRTDSSSVAAADPYGMRAAKTLYLEAEAYAGSLLIEGRGLSAGAGLLIRYQARKAPNLILGVSATLGHVRVLGAPGEGSRGPELDYTGTNTTLSAMLGARFTAGKAITPFAALRLSGLFSFYGVEGSVPGTRILERVNEQTIGVDGGIYVGKLGVLLRLERAATFADSGLALVVRYRL